MEYRFRKKAFVLLADGTQFFGKSIGIEGSAFGEICFNTGMTGYQEIFTDPSYFGQLMVTVLFIVDWNGESDRSAMELARVLFGLYS